MKIEELSVNNYVEIHKEIYKVTRVYQSTIEGTLITDEESKCIPYFKDVKPIPITLEFLQKNGFEWDNLIEIGVKTIKERKIEIGKCRDGFIVYDCCDDNAYITKCRAFIKNIHQLQNFLTLCGVELKIKM